MNIQVGDLVVGNFFHHGKIGLVVQIGNAPVETDQCDAAPEELALVVFTHGSRAWEPLDGLRKV